ncbi:hypothetical protein TsFJ059_007705 [Trichoderma semiorbis]|uniref:Uncharacterized protein n=1 Tax=Trichoderma semiorbis TaxID=1491008 RepID=A0A9P8KNM3_9HYPO|nr:hypothetical protein TsFJ059_007705 [Trichoderma semiorbis]
MSISPLEKPYFLPLFFIHQYWKFEASRNTNRVYLEISRLRSLTHDFSYSSNTSVNMNNVPALEWVVEIYELYLTAKSFRSAAVQVGATIGPGVDVGWISSATVLLLYGQTLLGRMTLENKMINSSITDDALVLQMEEFEIQDMTAFKSFVRNIMPKPWNGCRLDKAALTGKLGVVDKGHSLAIAIDLCGIGGLETTELNVTLSSDILKITFSMTNATTVEIYFDEAEFQLEKNGVVLATLAGDFNIETGNIETGETTYELKGEIYSFAREDLFGNATLVGYHPKDNDLKKTWLIHALREFKIDVNLDQMVVY